MFGERQDGFCPIPATARPPDQSTPLLPIVGCRSRAVQAGVWRRHGKPKGAPDGLLSDARRRSVATVWSGLYGIKTRVSKSAWFFGQLS